MLGIADGNDPDDGDDCHENDDKPEHVVVARRVSRVEEEAGRAHDEHGSKRHPHGENAHGHTALRRREPFRYEHGNHGADAGVAHALDKAADDQKLIRLRKSADDCADERTCQNHERRFLRTELHDDGCRHKCQDKPDVAVQRHQRAERTGVDAQRRQHERRRRRKLVVVD